MSKITCEACRLGEHHRCVELRRPLSDSATPIACWCDCGAVTPPEPLRDLSAA